MSRPVLRVGDTGGEVKELQRLLNVHLRRPTPLLVSGKFDESTRLAVRAFQRLKRLLPDGVVGSRTWTALERVPHTPAACSYDPGPQAILADIALPYVGATEARGNRMGTDPRMREIFESDHLTDNGVTDGYPWCCAFVSLCVQKLIQQRPAYRGLTRPTTASVRRFREVWAPSQHCLQFDAASTEHQPHRGDIVVYTFSHIGIVDAVGEGVLTAIEGNTNEAGSREGTTCRRQQRLFNLVRSFIRLPVRV